MNKKIISALVLAGMILSTTAFASRARLGVMGQGGAGDGSYAYDNIYNIFYNPSYVNDMKNYVIFEKDADNTTFMGFASSMHGFNTAFYLNRAGANTFGSGTTYGNNPLEVVVGGDQGMKWGLGLMYARSAANTAAAVPASDKTNTAFGVRAGIQMNGLDPFASYSQGKSYSNAVTPVETKDTEFQVGLRYHYGEWVPYASYMNNKQTTTGSENKVNQWTLGLARETKLAEGARLGYAVYYQADKTTIATVERSNNRMPVEASIEADATSWLTLRAGFTYMFAKKDAGNTTNTTGAIGGTFHIGKVDADFAFGNQLNGTAGAATNTTHSPNVGFDSSTFSQIAMRYSW